MAQIEMVIDSVRTGSRLINKQVVILKEKLAERYLPVYIGLRQADILKKVLMGEQTTLPADDDPKLSEIDKVLSLADSVSLIIQRFQDDIFHAKFMLARRDESHQIDCPCAWALVLGVRVGARIFAEEGILDSAGIDATV